MEINLSNLKQAMTAQLDRNNVLANNLANINTNGFKKDLVFFETLNDEVDGLREGSKQSIDLAQGQLKKTDNPLDLALSGQGFFMVETENGEAFTREGHFKLDDDGILRTSAGHPVMGEGGWISVVGDDINPKSITVSKDGDIFADEIFIDRLRISDFENKADLNKIGNNLFVARDAALPQDVESVEIHQGFLEQSNVNPADEMIQLIEVQRQFESIQKMVRSLDDIFRVAANQVGKY